MRAAAAGADRPRQARGAPDPRSPARVATAELTGPSRGHSRARRTAPPAGAYRRPLLAVELSDVALRSAALATRVIDPEVSRIRAIHAYHVPFEDRMALALPRWSSRPTRLDTMTTRAPASGASWAWFDGLGVTWSRQSGAATRGARSSAKPGGGRPISSSWARTGARGSARSPGQRGRIRHALGAVRRAGRAPVHVRAGAALSRAAAQACPAAPGRASTRPPRARRRERCETVRR